MFIIQTQEALEKLLSSIKDDNNLSIDTEFVRFDTYFAKLSLIQLSYQGQEFIIDYLSELDLASFKLILLNPKIKKIFHSPREDLQIFYDKFRLIPNNLFDTQIAASICGFGKCVSYANLCQKLFDIVIDKECQRSDWMMRPLSIDMAKYATIDVKYLEKIYLELVKTMQEKDLMLKYSDFAAYLNDRNTYINYEENAWTKIKFSDHSEEFIKRVRIFAAFRESYAQKLNIPKRHFITDQELLDICKMLPKSKKDFDELKTHNKYLKNHKIQTRISELSLVINEDI